MDTRYGAVVLCGGESSRMGRDKATLPFGARTLLEHVVDTLRQIVPARGIVVVAARDQQLPALGGGVTVARDNGDGPLVALIEGLARRPSGVETMFACGCDAPLLQPGFVKHLFELVTPDVEVVVPVDDVRWHPLAAAYAPNSMSGLSEALRAGERSLHRALQSRYIRTRPVHVSEFRGDDPELLTLVNCNLSAEYEAALQRAGLPHHLSQERQPRAV